MADENDLDILAWTMLGEAAGEGPQGMADVGHVILNRLNNGDYGSSIADVAKSPKQFSTWNSGAGGNNPTGRYPKDSAEFKRARELAAQVVAGTIPGPPGRPLDYNAPSVSPYWADSKARHDTYERNGHVFYPSVPVPPGEVPNAVGTLTDTVPPRAPMPVTSTPDLAMMRRASMPSQLIPDTFASLPARSRSLGDEIAMSPVQGGRQQAPLFDAAYDERVGSMRMTREPIDSQGMSTGFSRPPAPVPASVFDRVTARLNALPPVSRLPEIAPPPSIGSAPTTRTVQSVPVPQPRTQVSASDMARGRSSALAAPSVRPAIPQSFAGMERGAPLIPDRLAPGLPGMPAIYGDFAPQQVAKIGVPAFPDPTQPRIRVASAAPFPMPRPGFMPQVGTQLAVTRPALPMPNNRGAPIPLPFAARPQMQSNSAPLRIVVQGAQPQQSLYYSNPNAFGQQAVNQSGDSSSGSQAEAAAARASGEAWRASRR